MTEEVAEKEKEEVPERPKPLTWLETLKYRREFRRLRSSLEEFHGLFYQLCSMGIPNFTYDIPTSAVSFSKKHGGMLTFMWNPDFWDECDEYTRAFVTCHEILHVMLNHGSRMSKIRGLKAIVNQALDVAINHSLVDFFGFDRKKVLTEAELCWIDTVFKEDAKDIEPEREYEYYFDEILKRVTWVESTDGTGVPLKGGGHGIGKALGKGGALDNHEYLPEEEKRLEEEIRKAINRGLTPEEKKDFHDKCAGTVPNSDKEPDGKETEQDKKDKGKLAGTTVGNTCYEIILPRPKYNMKWTQVIHNWRRSRGREDGPDDVWHDRERRFALMTPDIMLPHCKEEDETEIEQIDVWFFQDVSGSCVSMAEKFFNAARTFPPNKFRVRAFCFDTEVREIDLSKGKIVGGGGTAFVPIETKIQELMHTEKAKHPDAVFVFTDGYSWDQVNPQFPKKWYWFLGTCTHTDQYIPKACNKFLLSEFVTDG